jgi:hypothetical protein
MFDAIEDVEGDAFCSGRVMFADVRAQLNEVVDRFGRPYERHIPYGDGRSWLVSHDVAHCLTRSCGMPSPRSREEKRWTECAVELRIGDWLQGEPRSGDGSLLL